MGFLTGAALAGVTTWGAKKAVSAALNTAKTTATQKFTDVAKNKVGEAIFGQKINEAGQLDNKNVDFRGHTRYKVPEPTGLIAFLYSKSVIAVDDLDSKLKDQAMKAWDEQHTLEQRTEQRALGIPDAPPLEPANDAQQVPPANDAKVAKPVNKPISLDDFRGMVTEGKGAKNKGYVRFVKCDDGKGVTLAKVGNKCGLFMSWRLNVTKEHNRQMRQLLAETLLDDFGGPDGILAVEANKPSKFGAFLDEKLASLKASIVNQADPSRILKRTEIRDALKIYDSIFTPESKQRIVSSFLAECLRQCQYSGPHEDVALNVKEFLREYGSCADVASLEDLVAAAKEAQTGAALRAALESIEVAFAKMNVVWQQDLQAKTFLKTVVAEPTTAYSPDQHVEQLGKLKGAILRHFEGVKDAADRINQFFAKGKVFDTLVAFHRETYWKEVERGVEGKEAGRNLRDKLSLKAIIKEVTDYIARLDEELANKTAPTAVEIIRNAKQDELNACILSQIELRSRVGAEKELEELEKKSAVLKDEIAWLEEQTKLFAKDAAPKDLQQLLAEKDIGQNDEKLRTWSKEALGAVLASGHKALDEQFHIDYITQNYLAERCPGIENSSQKSVQEIMTKIVNDFKAVVTKALAANVRDVNDISLGDLIEELGDFLMSETLTDGLKNESFKVSNRNPYRSIRNTRQTSPQIFVENVMRVSVEHALQQKLEKGTAFADMKLKLENRATIVGKQLAKLFEAIAGKDSKLKGYRSYVSDTRIFQQRGAIKAEQWNAEKVKYRDGARLLLRVTLLDPFLTQDLPKLLDEKDVDFEKKAQARLNWRVEELMVAFKKMNVQQFYEGALKFDTVAPLEPKTMHALFGVPVKDEDTGYTDPQRVGQTFRAAFKELMESQRKILVLAKRPSFVLTNDEINPLIANKAEEAWRQDVVAHAPGRLAFTIFNTILEKFQNFLNVKIENRQVDLTSDWLKKRSQTLGDEVSTLMRGYLDFEKKVVKYCRAEITKALAASGNPVYTQTRDTAVRDRLVDAVLGDFKAQIGDLLKNYLAHPEAMTDYLKGDGNRLQGLVLEALGTGCEKKAADALIRVVATHADIVKGRLEDKHLQTDMVTTLLKDISDGKIAELKDLQAVSDAVTWAVEQAVEEARKHPVEAYEEELATFQENLVVRAQKNLTTVARPFAEQIKLFDQKLTAAFNAQKAKIDQNPVLGSYAVNAQADMRTEFTKAFCSLALTRAKDRKTYTENLQALVDESIQTFSARLEQAIRLAEERQVTAFRNLSETFGEVCRNAEGAFAVPGVSMEALVWFRKACGDAWSDVNKRFGEKLTAPTLTDGTIADALANAKEELRVQIDAIAKDASARLVQSESRLTAENLAKILAHFGITPEQYPNELAFDDALQYLVQEPTVIACFNAMQEKALVADAKNIPSIRQDAAWEKSFVPGFKAYYELQVNKRRLDAQRDEIEGAITKMTLAHELSDEDIQAIRVAATATTEEAVKTVFMAVFSSLQTIGEELDLDKIGKTTIDVKAALEAAQAKMEALLHDNMLAKTRRYWVEEKFEALFNPILAKNDAFIQPKGTGKDIAGIVESNCRSFQQQLKIYLQDLVAKSEDPEVWAKTFAADFGDQPGAKVPPVLGKWIESAGQNIQDTLRAAEMIKTVDKLVKAARKEAVKHFFLKRGTSKKTAETYASPADAVEAYLHLHAPVDPKKAGLARDCAIKFEALLAPKLEDLGVKLKLAFVHNSKDAMQPTTGDADRLVDGLMQDLRKDPGYQIMRDMVRNV